MAYGSDPAQQSPGAGGYATGILGGAASGAATGAVAGPYGAILGGVVGAGLGALSASQQQNAQANIPSYQVPDYGSTINYLKNNFSVPSYQNYTATDPLSSYQQFLDGGNKYAGKVSNFLESTNDKSNSQYRHDLFSTSPTLQGNLATQGANTQSFLNGQIPTDVQVQLANRDAGTSLLGGYGGSQMARNLTARDLGLTSLDLINQGNQGLQSQLGYSQALNPYQSNTLDYLMNPSQLLSTDIQQNQYGNNVYNQNQTNTSTFKNQQTGDISQLMQAQALANAGGANTNSYIDWERNNANPGLAAAAAGFGAISPYLGSSSSYGLQGNTGPANYNYSQSSGLGSTNWLQGLFGNTANGNNGYGYGATSSGGNGEYAAPQYL